MINIKVYDDMRRDRDRWKAKAQGLARRIYEDEAKAARTRRRHAACPASRLDQLFAKPNIGDDAVVVEPLAHRVSA